MEQNRKEVYMRPLLMKHEQLVDITGTMSGKKPREKRHHHRHGYRHRFHGKHR